VSHAALSHAVNGFFDAFRSKPSSPQVAAQPASRASRVRVESRYNEGDDESLLESATSLPRPTLKALEKAIRSDGFKGASVSGWSQGQRGGFTVHYGGEQYEFEISENTTPRPVGEIGRLVKESGRYGHNGRRTGILSDGTRVNAYRYGDEWTAALHYPDGGYSALVMIGGKAEFDEHNLEGPHMGAATSWEAVPASIKRDIEQRAVESSMVANRFTRSLHRPAGPSHPGSSYHKNASTTVDPVAAHELDLYIANTYELIGAPNSIGKSIDTNLKRKLASGKYDPALAPKAWQHLVDQGAKRYEKEFGDSSPIFNAATRRQVAADFARAWESENGMTPNARRSIPSELQGYEGWTAEDFYNDLIDDGQSKQAARVHAKRYSHAVGTLDFLPPRVPAGWTLHSSPIWNRRTGKVAFEAYKGSKYMVFDQSGKPISPELRRIRGLIEWRDANGYIDSR
jgi:hypothetical protein